MPLGGIRLITLKLKLHALSPKATDLVILILSIYLGQYRCPKAFYAKNQTSLSNIRHKVPLSKRPDFTKDLTCSPPSTKYLHRSVFEKNTNKGKSFGSSREGSPDRSYLIPQLQKIPGPGNV